MELWALFVSSFLASTILPLASEVPLAMVVRRHGELFTPIAVATFGNYLGACTTYGLACAAVTGFGIGSLLTPAIAFTTGTRAAARHVGRDSGGKPRRHPNGGDARLWAAIALALAGVAVGTLSGERLLARVPERSFRMVVGTLLVLLGLSFLLPITPPQ